MKKLILIFGLVVIPLGFFVGFCSFAATPHQMQVVTTTDMRGLAASCDSYCQDRGESLDRWTFSNGVLTCQCVNELFK